MKSMKNLIKKAIVSVLQWEARLIIKKYKPKIIAITGSVGKTTTKDAIFSVLVPSRYIRKSEKSFNSELGVPLTILGCDNGWNNPLIWLDNILHGLNLVLFKQEYPNWLVLEVGADRPGDIKSITSWLKPDVSVVTRFGKTPVHIEYFESREDVILEKSYLVRALRQDGTAILNYDDEDVRAFGGLTEGNKIYYGFDGGEIKASHYKVVTRKVGKNFFPVGISFTVDYVGKPILVEIMGSLGKHHVYPVLAAVAVGCAQGLEAEQVQSAIKTHIPVPGRMHLIKGIKNSLIIDDTYNASPVATLEALNTLATLEKVTRRIAILADMMELGVHSGEAHKEVGIHAVKCCDLLIAVGVRARKIAESALDFGMSEKNVYQFDTAKEAGSFIQNFITAGDVVLVKGSQSMRMEQAVKEIMLEPEYAGQLLVRQDEEWAKR
jgi:UDP-N-acetylmuramoyl-tripeptide--D-alanyl-D-alanine ligase